MPQVTFENLVKQYGRYTVLENLNLTVEDGEFLVLLGPSGCGKTTLLNLLAGLMEVTAGRILIGGRDVTDLDPKDRGLAMVFQSYALYPTKTVYGNLKFGLAAHKLKPHEIERRILWAADLLQIRPLLKRKPAQLSGGQRQRVAIGRALVKNVGVFLFDEPLSNLDAKLRTEMRLEIKKLHDTLKHTIVYVTHDQIEAMTMATRIAVMDAGVIQQVGAPDEVYETPENLFVAGFIGSPAMNMLPAKLIVGGNRVAARHEPTGTEIDLTAYPFRVAPEDGLAAVVGVRPEDLVLNGSAEAAGRFRLPVQHTERTGGDATAYLQADGALMAMRLDPVQLARVRPGDVVEPAVAAGKANLFDARSGRRL